MVPQTHDIELTLFPFLGASRLQTVRFSSTSNLQLPTRLPILTSAAAQHFVYLMTGLTTKTLTESSPRLPSPTHLPQHQHSVFLETGPVTALLKASQRLPQIFAFNIQGPKVLFLWYQPTSQKPVTMDTFTVPQKYSILLHPHLGSRKCTPSGHSHPPTS